MPRKTLQAPFLGVTDASPFIGQPPGATDPDGLLNMVPLNPTSGRRQLSTRAKARLEFGAAAGSGRVNGISSIARSSAVGSVLAVNPDNSTEGQSIASGLFRGQAVVLDQDRSVRLVLGDTRGTGLSTPPAGPGGYGGFQCCWHSTDPDIGYFATIARDTAASPNDNIIVGLNRLSLATNSITHQRYCLDTVTNASVADVDAAHLLANQMVQHAGYLFVCAFHYVYCFRADDLTYIRRHAIDWTLEVQGIAVVAVAGRDYLLALTTGNPDVSGPIVADATGSEQFGEFSRAAILAHEIRYLGNDQTTKAPVAAASTVLVRKPMPQGTPLPSAIANRVAQFAGTDWSRMTAAGMSGFVETLAVLPGGDVAAGGSFLTAGGVTVNRIARWNGSAWSALGTGMNDEVRALAVIGTDLYAGGTFTLAGGVPNTSGVARWNGTSWTPLGTGTNGGVLALLADGTDLYAAGDFTAAGGVANTTRIARWNTLTSTWHALGAGLDGRVRALAKLGAAVVAGGDFTQANTGPVAVNRIAQWNGTAWSSVGAGAENGVNGSVYALAASGTDLHVGGAFTLAGTVANTTRIAKWNGAVWSAIGTGANDTVQTITQTGASEYAVGGYFTLAGGVAGTAYVAKWNGSAWSTIGSQLNGAVNAIVAPVAGALIAGGGFTIAGGGGYEDHRSFRPSEFSAARPRGCIAYGFAASATAAGAVHAYIARTNQGFGYNGNEAWQRPDGTGRYISACRAVLTRAFEDAAPAAIDPSNQARYGLSPSAGGWERDSDSLRRPYTWGASTYQNDIPAISGGLRDPHAADNEPTFWAVALNADRNRVYFAGRRSSLSGTGPTVYAFDADTGTMLWYNDTGGTIHQNGIAIDPSSGNLLVAMSRNSNWYTPGGAITATAAEMLELNGETGQAVNHFDLTSAVNHNGYITPVNEATRGTGAYGVAVNSRGQALVVLAPFRYVV